MGSYRFIPPSAELSSTLGDLAPASPAGSSSALAVGSPPPVSGLFGCLYLRPSQGSPRLDTLIEIAEAFSPRFERLRDDLVAMDLRGLDRLFGTPRMVGEEMRRDAASRGVHVHIGIATSRTVATVMALARPGLTVVPAGGEAAALAQLPLTVLQQIEGSGDTGAARTAVMQKATESSGAATAAGMVAVLTRWGLRTCGELAGLPAADLSARMGRAALPWQAIARGEDVRPLVPTRAEERFDATMELEWPIEGLEPLSFVLTRLLEPLSTRLERCDRGAAALHVVLRLVNRTEHARRLDIPSPMREVRALRTLALLDLEAHPPDAGIDRVTITIDPTPGRILQHTLFARPHPTPEQLSTLLARLTALMGQDRIGVAAPVDSRRPGACALTPFPLTKADDKASRASAPRALAADRPPLASATDLPSALRRYRQPLSARVVVADGRPIRVSTDRVGWGGGAVTACAGPWRTSGAWWDADRERPARDHRTAVPNACDTFWDRDEWDVALADGGMYRIFQDRPTGSWFIDSVVD